MVKFSSTLFIMYFSGRCFSLWMEVDHVLAHRRPVDSVDEATVLEPEENGELYVIPDATEHCLMFVYGCADCRML